MSDELLEAANDEELNINMYACWAVNQDGSEERDPVRKKHRRRVAHNARQWCQDNASQYDTKEDAHDACKVFVVDDLILAWIAETVISWIVWKMLDHLWEKYHKPAELA